MRHRLASLFARDVTIVNYHHFACEPCEATRHLGITTSPASLDAQLDYFDTRYSVISLDRLLASDIPPRALLITIDDAYKSVLDIAAPALASRGLPAVFFVNPRPLERPFVQLDNVLSLALCRLGIAETSRVASSGTFQAGSYAELTGSYLAALSVRELVAVKTRLLEELSYSEAELHKYLDLYLAPTDLKRLAAQGIEIANHSMSHCHCGILSPAELRAEIVVAKKRLEEMTHTPVRAFAFPWGQERDATTRALDIIRSSGHKVTFLVHARSNVTRPAADIWYRTGVTDESGWRLGMALSVLPRLRSLRDGPGALRLPATAGRKGIIATG